jgi:hypothetical protein
MRPPAARDCAVIAEEPIPMPKVQKSQPVSAPAPAIVPSDAEKAFKALGPRLAAIPRDTLAVVNVDMQLAAVFALGVSRVVTEPAVRARFASLAKGGEYDDACVDDLGPVAQAAWYARHRFVLASATRTEARLSIPLLEEATALRGRMLKLVEYWLSDDGVLGAEIAAIRTGTGHQDLANDLIALGALFERHGKTLAQDRKLYDASNATTANRLAGEILQQLGAAATQEQNEWAAMQPRAWTLLFETYEEVRRGGRFLFADERGEERFPSLIVVGRAPVTRSPAKADSAKGEGANGSAPMDAAPLAEASAPA